jgi:hypothetical protein
LIESPDDACQVRCWRAGLAPGGGNLGGRKKETAAILISSSELGQKLYLLFSGRGSRFGGL